jgi:hypothetical protein
MDEVVENDILPFITEEMQNRGLLWAAADSIWVTKTLLSDLPYFPHAF